MPARLLLLAVIVLIRTETFGDERISRRPNVLLIMADDLRNDLGCYGHSEVLSPRIDGLAAHSTQFERAYCQQAVCNPSRASMFTGRRPDQLQIWDLPTHFRASNPDVVTLPQYFKQQGYFTQDVGKIFHNWGHDIQGDPVSWSVPAVMHFNTHGRDTPLVNGQLPPNLANDPKCFCFDVPDDAYFDGRIATQAIDALQERRDAAQPFFLAVGFWKPHSPFNAPKSYWDLYDRGRISMPKNPEWPTDAPRIAWHDGRELLGYPQTRTLSSESIREIRHGYLANISYLDAQVGRVLDELQQLGLSDSTIVVFTSDHGYHLGEQTLWAKTSNFELDARVPLLISTPGQSTGAQTMALAELIDLFPTLTDLCALPTPDGLAGMSLKPVLDDPDATVKSAALTQHPRPAYYDRAPDKTPTTMGYSLRIEPFRYVEWRDWKTGEVAARELYDHHADPDETRNLAVDPDHAADIARCTAELSRLHPIVRPGWTPTLPKSDD
ncbi:MAG: sulfatase [Planctomycetaceae bacterium]